MEMEMRQRAELSPWALLSKQMDEVVATVKALNTKLDAAIEGFRDYREWVAHNVMHKSDCDRYHKAQEARLDLQLDAIVLRLERLEAAGPRGTDTWLKVIPIGLSVAALAIAIYLKT